MPPRDPDDELDPTVQRISDEQQSIQVMDVTAYSKAYDAPAVVALIYRVFPKATYDVLIELTGGKLRMISRWCKGESRVPPKLVAKLEVQDDHKRAFDADLSLLIKRYGDAGMMRAVMRQSLLGQVNGTLSDFDESL